MTMDIACKKTWLGKDGIHHICKEHAGNLHVCACGARKNAGRFPPLASICPSCGRTDRTEFANCSNEWHRKGVKIVKKSVAHG